MGKGNILGLEIRLPIEILYAKMWIISLSLSHIQQIRGSRLGKHLGKIMEIPSKGKFNHWKELKRLLQRVTILVMSNVLKSCLLQRHQKAWKKFKWKYDNWIELKILWQKKKLFHFSFYHSVLKSLLLQRRQKAYICRKGCKFRQILQTIWVEHMGKTKLD